MKNAIVNRVMRLEQSQQNANAKCYPLSYFYGYDAQPETLIIGQTLSDFYTSITRKDTQHG
ncbi:MAG: hypothetical protein QX199_15345 [Methylococcaceae bacterium]